MIKISDLSDAEITIVLIGGGLAIATLLCISVCLLFVFKNTCLEKSSVSKSNGSVKESSHALLRGQHPMAFVLPSVSMSETASEKDSDLDGLATGYSSSTTSISHHSSVSYFPYMSQVHSPTRITDHPYLPLASERESPPAKNMIGARSMHRNYRPLVQRRRQRYSSDEQNLIMDEDFAFPDRSEADNLELERIRRISPLYLKHHPFATKEVEPHVSEPTCPSSMKTHLGKMRLILQLRASVNHPFCTLQIQNLELIHLNQSAFEEGRVSVRMTVLPDYSEYRETLIGLVESGSCQLDETVEWDNLKRDEDVVKLTVVVRGIPRRKVYGHALLELGTFSESLPLQSVELDILESVSDRLDELFHDVLELSLMYNPDEGRLTLGVIQCQLASVSNITAAHIYVKVTLFERNTVIKAKKTRLVAIGTTSVRQFNFNESFSIIFPQSFLQYVSCIISLCGKTNEGRKFVIGRTSIGEGSQCSSQGLDHWHAMVATLNNPIHKRHKLI